MNKKLKQRNQLLKSDYLQTERHKVYDLVKKYPGITGTEACGQYPLLYPEASAGSCKTSSIRGRLTELKRDGMILVAGHKKDPQTNMIVETYEVTNYAPNAYVNKYLGPKIKRENPAATNITAFAKAFSSLSKELEIALTNGRLTAFKNALTELANVPNSTPASAKLVKRIADELKAANSNPIFAITPTMTTAEIIDLFIKKGA